MSRSSAKISKGAQDRSRDLIERFQRDCVIRGLTPESIVRYISTLRIFDGFLRAKGLDLVKVDGTILRDWLEYLRIDRKVSQKTLENYFTEISSFYEFLLYEGLIAANPVAAVRKRYLRRYKNSEKEHTHKLISPEDMGRLINATMDIRDRAIIALLAKTGIRRRELIALDVEDVDFVEQSVILKPTAKRSNRVVFFDGETALILRRWLRAREGRNHNGCKALFLSNMDNRLERTGISHMVVKNAQRVGLHNPNSDRMEDHFSPHCCRHWFTTHLRRAGMPREFIQELRGDARREAIDIYDHIDKKELRESYLAHIPQLGI
jgi:integrase/recombinase XerD